MILLSRNQQKDIEGIGKLEIIFLEKKKKKKKKRRLA